MSALECEVCGLAECDLPDVVDPELFFEPGERGGMHCPTCPEPCKPGCIRGAGHDGDCLDDEDVAEERLRSRDYDAWAAL